MISTSKHLQHIISIALGIATGILILTATTYSPRLGGVLILALLLFFIGIATGQGKKLLLLVMLVEIPIQMDVYLQYRDSAAQLNALPGLNLSVTTITLAVLYTVWFIELLSRRTTIPPLLLRLVLPSLTYLGVVIFSLLVARDIEMAIFEMVLVFQAVLLFIYIIYAIHNRQELTFAITALMAALAVESLIMIGLYLVGNSYDIGIIQARIDPSRRVGGTIGSPNTAASFLTMLLGPALGLFLARVNKWHKFFALAAFSLGSIALLVTFSRGGWLSFGISTAIVVFLAWRRGLIGLRIPFTLAAAALIGFIVLRAQIIPRFTDDEGAASSRIPLVQTSIQMIQDKPVFGIGANNYAVELPDYSTMNLSIQWNSVVHNKYLLVWTETGLAGLFAFLWFLLSTLRRGYRLWLADDPLLSPIALGFTAAVTGFMVHMLFDLFNGRPQIQILWLSAGILAAMTSMAEAAGLLNPQKPRPQPSPAGSAVSFIQRLK